MRQDSYLRDATPEDSLEIAKLVLIASDGLAEYIWSLYAGPGDDLLEVGASRYQRTGVDYSFENTRIAEVDGRVAGMLLTYGIGELEPVSDDVPDVLRPYAALEEPDSLYISDVAIHARFRGQGLGKRLMADAHQIAAAKGYDKLSLIVFERNTFAHGLYIRLGFEERDRRAIVPHPCLNYEDGDAIMMVKEI